MVGLLHFVLAFGLVGCHFEVNPLSYLKHHKVLVKIGKPRYKHLNIIVITAVERLQLSL